MRIAPGDIIARMSAAPITAPTETTPIARAANGAPATATTSADAALFQLLLGNTDSGAAMQPTAATPISATAPVTSSPLGVLALQTEPDAAPEATQQAATGVETSESIAAPTAPLATPEATPTVQTPAPPSGEIAAQQTTPQSVAQQPAQTQTAQTQITNTKSAEPKSAAPTNSEETPADQTKAEAAPPADAPAQPAAILPTALAAQAIAPQPAPVKAAPAATEPSEAPVDGAAPVKFAGGPKKAGAPAAAPNGNTGSPGPNPVAVNTTGGERVAATPIADTMAPGTPAMAPPATSAQATTTDTATQAAARPALQSPAAMSVAQQIVRRFDGQSTSFQMRMDPPELGKVEVRLNVDRNKKVTASVSADNPQTLTELRASARDLERALNEAGLDLAQNGLSFDLKDERPAQGGDYAGAASGSPSNEDDNIGALVTPAARPFGMERWGGGGVDVWA